jgi:cyanate permease
MKRMAASDRKRLQLGSAPQPFSGPITIGVVAFLAFYILLAIQVAPPGLPEHHFRSERGLITTLSAVLLAAAAVLAASCCAADRSAARGSLLFWAVLACGLLFFALDEWFEFHERIDSFLSSTRIGPARAFRNWNDVIVIGYGVLGVYVLFYFLPVLLRLPAVAEALSLALGFYLLHTLIDCTQAPSSLSIILEESAKLMSSAFLALAALFGRFALQPPPKKAKA